MIAYADAKYLKHAGAQIDVKVTIRPSGDGVMIYIRDEEFPTFKSALRCLQRIAEGEIARDASVEAVEVPS